MTEIRHSVGCAAWAPADPGFLRRVRKTSIILGVGLAAPIATYRGLAPAAGWSLGIAWSVVNLLATESIVRLVLTLEPRSRSRIARGLVVKFGLLYGSAALLLALLRVPALWWAAGFTWPLFVALMKALGRSYLGLDTLVGIPNARRRTS